MLRFTIDCSAPVAAQELPLASFKEFLDHRLRVCGTRCWLLGGALAVTRDKSKLHVAVVPPLAKRYLKQLTTEFLALQMLSDKIDVVASDKQTCTLRYLTATAHRPGNTEGTTGSTTSP